MKTLCRGSLGIIWGKSEHQGPIMAATYYYKVSLFRNNGLQKKKDRMDLSSSLPIERLSKTCVCYAVSVMSDSLQLYGL